jgi:hypothetical protein
MSSAHNAATLRSEARRFGARLMSAIQDEQLALDQNGLSNHGARPDPTKQPVDIRDDVDEKGSQITHDGA